MSIAVVIIHRGNPMYLKLAIKQAKHYNNDVILIGDDSNKKMCVDYGALHYPIDSFSNTLSERFQAVYQHMSTNSKEFEYLCFNRWFILLELMKKEKLETVLYIDSDVMLYGNVPLMCKDFISRYSSGYCIAKQTYEEYKWDASAHTSFWNAAALEHFCHFILDQYQQKAGELKMKWEWHLQNKIPGGICDMNVLYLYYLKNKEKVMNLAEVSSTNVTFDNNINNSSNIYKDEYKVDNLFMLFRKKKIRFIDLKPVGDNLLLKKEVIFGSLHFQGVAKEFMFYFFQDKVPLPQTMIILSKTLKFGLKKLMGKA